MSKKRGRPPLPIAQHLARGTFRRDRHGPRPAQVPATYPNCSTCMETVPLSYRCSPESCRDTPCTGCTFVGSRRTTAWERRRSRCSAVWQSPSRRGPTHRVGKSCAPPRIPSCSPHARRANESLGHRGPCPAVLHRRHRSMLYPCSHALPSVILDPEAREPIRPVQPCPSIGQR